MAKSRPRLVAPGTVNRTVTPKRPPNADLRTREYLTEAEVDQFACPEAMAIADQDHGGVPMAPAIAPGGPEQPFDLGLRQVLAGAQVGVAAAPRCDCSIYGARATSLRRDFAKCFAPRA